MRTWSNTHGEALPDGPWKVEPDKAQWVDEATGLDCLIHRAPLGHLCGYVGVPPEHPWHGLGYSGCRSGCEDGYCDHSPGMRLFVHGGITYADACMEGDDPSVGICHVPEPGRPDDVWWFGFDCAHMSDLSPGMRQYSTVDTGGEYRTFEYVRAEVESLALQLMEAAE